MAICKVCGNDCANAFGIVAVTQAYCCAHCARSAGVTGVADKAA